MVQAVHDLSFGVERGEMVGYIGPNGAGKSTTIKMLTGHPGAHVRAGCASPGIDPSRNRVELTRRIGVVFGQRTTLWWDLPLRDSFDLLRRIYRVDTARHRRNLAEFTELLDLGDLLDTPVRQLSLGQRMRGDIAAALLHDPEILYLDEPTIGLDVVSKGRLREFLRRVNEERAGHAAAHHARPPGHRAALPTGDGDRPRLAGVRRLAGRPARAGRLDPHAGGRPRGRGSRRSTYRGRAWSKVEGPRQWLCFPADASAAPVVAAVAAAYDVADLSIQEPDIEAVIREIYLRGTPEVS